jgi:[acyl-carrier-protein] S-malonyltransferase
VQNEVAFVFPGQGSQTVGMLTDVAQHFDWVETLFAEASQVLDYDLWQIIREGPLERLNSTVYTQPAMLVADMVMWRVWQQAKGVTPVVLAGHSLGEYAAFVAAESMVFSDAVQLVSKRAQYMQETVAEGEGAMAAILALSEEQVSTICDEASGSDLIVQPVNFNAPLQIVIAGHTQAVDRALELAKQQGAKRAVKLPVSIPAHSTLMKPAADKLWVDLEKMVVHKPKIPVINHVDVEIYEKPNKIKDALKRQLFSPVRWIEVIEKIVAMSVWHIVECGPGKVLTGLNRRIHPDLQLYTLNSVDSLQQITF